MKRVLVITSCFPPINATGIHRTLALVRHLAARGYDVLVLTMPPAPDLDSDQSLLAKVPPQVQVIRVPMWDMTQAVKNCVPWRPKSPAPAATPRRIITDAAQTKPAKGRLADMIDWCTSWLQFPDSRIGWCLSAMWGQFRAIRRFGPDVIYSSAPMWSSHVMAMGMQRLLGRPWVADCRDPWRANPYRRLGHRAHDHADARLEAAMVRRASAVVCNTPGVQRDFAQRYPRQVGKFVAIPNGYEAAAVSAVVAQGRQANGHLRLVHAGVFYGSRSPDGLLAAMGALAREDPLARQQVQLVQVGPADYEGRPLTDLAAHYGVADMIELTGPLPHRKALQAVYDGDVALAVSQVGQQGDLQVPRKFYEYYGLGRCVLASGGCCGAIRELFDNRLPPGLWLVDEPATGPLTAVLKEMLAQWRRGELAACAGAGIDLTEDRMARDIERVLLGCHG